jgi:putative spermidine/putrescine transport system permease protein
MKYDIFVKNKLVGIVISVLCIVIIIPICLMFLYAFATKWFPSHWWFPQEFGTKWVFSILGMRNIISSLFTSYIIATITTIATIAITLPAAYVLGTRASHSVRRETQFVEALANLPLAFPTITVGLGLLPFFAKIGLLGTIPGIILAHMIMAIPYALRAIVGAFLQVPPNYEEAARNLGANRGYILRHIYFPLVWPGVIAGAIFAFSWSLNEFVLVVMLGFPNVETIPIQIYQFVGGYYFHPNQAAALGLFLLLPALLLMFIVEKLLKGSTVVPAGA